MVVSRLNDREDRVTHHTEAVERYQDDDRVLERLAKDPKTAPLDPEDKALGGLRHEAHQPAGRDRRGRRRGPSGGRFDD